MLHRRKFLLMLSILQITLGKLEDVEDAGNLSTTSLALCVSKIMRNYSTNHDIITLLSRIKSTLDKQQFSLENQFLKYSHACRSIQVFTNKGSIISSSLFLKSQIYIIFFSNMIELTADMTFLKDKFWNPHARFIIISKTHFNNRSSIVSDTIKLLWKLKAQKIIFLLPQRNNWEQFDVHTWFPYSNGNCADKFDEISIIDVCDNGKLSKNINLFPELVPLDLHHCPVRMKTVILPPYITAPENITNLKNINFTEGSEMLLMNNIAAKANFSVIYSVSEKELDWGELDQNETSSTGLYGSLVNDDCDIIMCYLEAAPLQYSMLDPSSPYTIVSYAWCVPIASYRPKWKSIYQVFSLYIWILILLCFTFIALVTYFVGNIGKRSQSFSGNLIYILSMFLNISVNIVPKTNLLRYLFILWCVFSLILTASYQSALIKFLVKPMKEKQISNVQELFDDSITKGYIYNWDELLEIPENKYGEKLSNAFVACYDPFKCLDDIAYHRNYSMPLPRLSVSYYISSTYKDENNVPLLYIFEESFLTIPLVMYSYDGFPFMPRIDDIINRLMQAGLASKWEKGALKTKPAVENYGNSKISLLNIQGVFYIYFLGISCAIVVFILETFLYRVKNVIIK